MGGTVGRKTILRASVAQLGMQIEEMQRRAMEVRTQFAAYERARYGSEWTTQDLVLGLTTDVGDLARIIQRLDGKRVGELQSAHAELEHEISDCIWSLLVLASRYEVDVPGAFGRTMDQLVEWLAENRP